MLIFQSSGLINMIRVKNLMRKMRTRAVPMEPRSRRRSLVTTNKSRECLRQPRKSSNSGESKVRDNVRSTGSRDLQRSANGTRTNSTETDLRERFVPTMTVVVGTKLRSCQRDQMQAKRQLHSFRTRSELGGERLSESCRALQEFQVRRQIHSFLTRSELGGVFGQNPILAIRQLHSFPTRSDSDSELIRAQSSSVFGQNRIQAIRQLHSFPPPTSSSSSSGEESEVEALAHKDMAVR